MPLVDLLRSSGYFVAIETNGTCTKMLSSVLIGKFRSDIAARQEFLSLVKSNLRCYLRAHAVPRTR